MHLLKVLTHGSLCSPIRLTWTETFQFSIFQVSACQRTILYYDFISRCYLALFNPLPHMPILGSSNSAANYGLMSKILTNGDAIF